MILDKIYAYGHENILSTHPTTIEITKDEKITEKGNCIIGINATKACFDLNADLKRFIKSGKKIKIILKVDNLKDSFYGFGNETLNLLDENDMVFRKSNFICDRTVLIRCTKSSSELNRTLIEKLKIPGKKFIMVFELNDFNEN